MFWFILALVGPLMYALTNHIDKILLEKYFKTQGAGTLILFSSLLSLIALPFILLFDHDVFNIGSSNILALFTVGIMNVGVLWLYLKALSDEEASVTVVFYQLVPVFGLMLGYLILNETITTIQLVAMAIVILGTSIISFEIDNENNFKLRKKTIVLMSAAAFLWALESVIFKGVALEVSVIKSLFWEHLALGIAGIIILVLIKSYRKHFLQALKNNSKSIIGLNVGNESLYMIGNITFSFAYMLAPIALVLLTESFQPIFVFVIGILLTIFFPKLSSEKIEAKHIWQKVMAIVITGIGTYLLFI